MGIVTSVLGSMVGLLLPDRPYWAVKLSTGKWACELDTRKDARIPGGVRTFDWTLDLVDTGDIARVRELWLFCPPNPMHPMGQTARLPIVDPYSCFQMKVGMVHAFGASDRYMASQIIGRVTNKVEGDCECFVWDAELNAMGTWNSNVYRMGSWREGIAPQGDLSFEVLGLRL